jgi:hypothetical protein
MTRGERTPGGLEVVRNTLVVAHLPIGGSNVNGDKIGPGYQIQDEAQAQHITRAAGDATRPLTVPKAAFCIDERGIIRLGEITDPAQLREVVANQLPGGTYIAATKAAVNANAALIRGAKTFNEAYDVVAGTLNRAGYEDAGHAGCGAGNKLVNSVREQVDPQTAYGTLLAVGAASEGDQAALEAMAANKQARVANGFYNSWDPTQHQALVARTAPQNYSYLQEEHDATHGHHASGIYLPTEPGVGFAKNAFIEDTEGSQLFAYTHHFAVELAQHLGGSEEERGLIALGFGYDLLDVSNQLIAAPDPATEYPGLAVVQQQFALAA